MKAEIKFTINEELINDLMESCHVSSAEEVRLLLKIVFATSIGKDMGDKISNVEINVIEDEKKEEVVIKDEKKEEVVIKDEKKEEVVIKDEIEADFLKTKATYDPYNCRTTIVCPKCGHEHGFLGRFLVNGTMSCEHCGRSFIFGYEEM